MASGGYRPGAGRPKKPVSEKILNGNPGKRPIEVLKFEDCDEIPHDPPDWLNSKGKKVYKKTVAWLEKIGCAQGILPGNIEEYAQCKARWLEAEETLNKLGLLVKDKSGNPGANPYIQFSQVYLKMTNDAWAKIYQVVRETKLTELDENSPNDDVMENILRGKK